jgi:hypothetical protein
MKRLAIVMVIGLALCALAPKASAGTFFSSPVYVSPGAAAIGSIQAARFSSDGTQYIGCQVTAFNGISANCFARDSSGNYISCNTTDPSMVQTAGGISSGSNIFFEVSGTTCSWLSVTNSSYYLQ